MNILVTGGAGFMGSHFVHHILNVYPTYRVVVFDKLTYAGNLENLTDVQTNPQYSFVQGDICSKSDVEAAVTTYSIEAIVNYAAETHVDRSIMSPDAFLRTAVLGTYQLLEAVKKFNLHKLVQVSTDEVYGSIAQGRFTEASPFAPNSPYSAAKAGGDLLCRSYAVTYGTPVVVTHSCNFYGPNQYPEKLIPLFITNLIEGKKVPLYGDGRNVREWIYTEDHCRAIDAVLHQAKPGSVYNIGTGSEIENIALTQMILKEMGFDEHMIEPVKDRPGHDRRYAIDATRITNDLDWRPQVPFAEGIKKTIAWYRENQLWWQKIKGGEFQEYYIQQYEKR